MYTLLALLALPLVFSAPVPAPAPSASGQVVPNLPAQVDLTAIAVQITATYTKVSGSGNRENIYGDTLNKYVPFGKTLDATVGQNNVIAIDVLADRLCIASANQGSACNELLAYAHAWYVAQQKGMTYKTMATYLGPNNMKAINDDLNALCLDNETGATNQICQHILGDTDTLANSIIGEDDASEDNNNSNTLQLLGLSAILPKPTTITV